MKKRFLLPTLLLVTFLSACGTKDNKTNVSSNETSKNVQVEETKGSAEVKEENAIFTGTLTEDSNPGEKEVIRLHLGEIKEEKDPDNIIGSFQQDGVILNASKTELKEGTKVEDLKKGRQVRFVLKQPAVITMSIPPQIPGNSILEIELLP